MFASTGSTPTHTVSTFDKDTISNVHAHDDVEGTDVSEDGIRSPDTRCVHFIADEKEASYKEETSSNIDTVCRMPQTTTNNIDNMYTIDEISALTQNDLSNIDVPEEIREEIKSILVKHESKKRACDEMFATKDHEGIRRELIRESIVERHESKRRACEELLASTNCEGINTVRIRIDDECDEEGFFPCNIREGMNEEIINRISFYEGNDTILPGTRHPYNASSDVEEENLFSMKSRTDKANNQSFTDMLFSNCAAKIEKACASVDDVMLSDERVEELQKEYQATMEAHGALAAQIFSESRNDEQLDEVTDLDSTSPSSATYPLFTPAINSNTLFPSSSHSNAVYTPSTSSIHPNIQISASGEINKINYKRSKSETYNTLLSHERPVSGSSTIDDVDEIEEDKCTDRSWNTRGNCSKKHNPLLKDFIRKERRKNKNGEETSGESRVERVKSILLRIEVEHGVKPGIKGKEFENEREHKILKVVEVMEDERVKMKEGFEKELHKKEEFLESEFYNKEQALLTKLQNIEKEYLVDVQKQREMNTDKLYGNIRDDILESKTYKILEMESSANSKCQNESGSEREKEEMESQEEKACTIEELGECEGELKIKKNELEKLEEKLKKALMEVEETQRLSIQEEVSRRKRLEIVEQQRLAALLRDERHRKMMWQEVDKTLAREVAFQQELLQKIRKEEISYKFLLSNQMSHITKSADAQREKMRENIDIEWKQLKEGMKEEEGKKYDKMDRVLAKKEEKGKLLTKTIKKQEDHIQKLIEQENRMNTMLAQRLEEITKMENVKREKMRVELASERHTLEKVLKLEERKALEELDRKLMTKEVAFNERLLQKEELKRREIETANLVHSVNKLKNEVFSGSPEYDKDVDVMLEQTWLHLDSSGKTLKLGKEAEELEKEHELRLEKLIKETECHKGVIEELRNEEMRLEEKLKELDEAARSRYLKHMEELEQRRIQITEDKMTYVDALEKQNERKLRDRTEELENLYKTKLKEMIDKTEMESMKIRKLHHEETELKSTLRVLEEEAKMRRTDIAEFTLMAKLKHIEEDAMQRRLQLDSDATIHMQEIEKQHENRLHELTNRVENENIKLEHLQIEQTKTQREMKVREEEATARHHQQMKQLKEEHIKLEAEKRSYVEYIENHDNLKLKEHMEELEKQHTIRLKEAIQKTTDETVKIAKLYDEGTSLNIKIETLVKDEMLKREQYEEEVQRYLEAMEQHIQEMEEIRNAIDAENQTLVELKKKVDAKQLQLANFSLDESTLWMKLKNLKEEVEDMKMSLIRETEYQIEQVEIEQGKRIKELTLKTEEERIKMERLWNIELKEKQEEFDKECVERQNELEEKLSEIEVKRMKQLRKQCKIENEEYLLDMTDECEKRVEETDKREDELKRQEQYMETLEKQRGLKFKRLVKNMDQRQIEIVQNEQYMEAREKQRGLSYKRLIRKAEDERVDREKDLEQEIKTRLDLFEDECREKEERLISKLDELETNRMDELDQEYKKKSDEFQEAIGKEYEKRLLEIKEFATSVFDHPQIIEKLEDDLKYSISQIEEVKNFSLEEYVTRRTKIEMQEELLITLKGEIDGIGPEEDETQSETFIARFEELLKRSKDEEKEYDYTLEYAKRMLEDEKFIEDNQARSTLDFEMEKKKLLEPDLKYSEEEKIVEVEEEVKENVSGIIEEGLLRKEMERNSELCKEMEGIKIQIEREKIKMDMKSTEGRGKCNVGSSLRDRKTLTKVKYGKEHKEVVHSVKQVELIRKNRIDNLITTGREAELKDMERKLAETQKEVELYKEKSCEAENEKRDTKEEISKLHKTIDGLKQSDISKDKQIKDLEEHLVMVEAKRLSEFKTLMHETQSEVPPISNDTEISQYKENYKRTLSELKLSLEPHKDNVSKKQIIGVDEKNNSSEDADTNNTIGVYCGKCEEAYSYKGEHNFHNNETTTFKDNAATSESTPVNEKAFKCDKCSKRFRKGSHLKRHQELHPNENKQKAKNNNNDIEKLYNCDICGSRFHLIRKIRKCRLFSQQKTNIYKCDLCGKQYLKLTQLQQHKSLHNHDTLQSTE